MSANPVQSRIEEKLQKQFQPLSLEVINESHLHAGHQENFDGKGETHFRIRIVAETFEGMSRVNRHRAINAMIVDEMDHGLHAIAIEAKSPVEAG